MIIYAINFTLCSGLLFLGYKIFLSSEKLYHFNRFYLIFSLIFSLVVPLINVNALYSKPLAFNQQTIFQTVSTFVSPSQLYAKTRTEKASEKNPAGQQIAKIHIYNYLVITLTAAYLIITLIMCIRFLHNLYHIYLQINRNIIVNSQNIRMVLIDEDISSHSFLQYIFINKTDFFNNLTEPEIICHEQAHANQLHSVDIILIELLQAIFWFNPFMLLYSKAMRLNHEFLADEVVIENHYDTAAYQYLVLAKLNRLGSMYLTSQFNYLTTKKRLIMMTKSTSTKTALYKKLAIIPMLITATLLFGHASSMAKMAPLGNKLTNTTLSFLSYNKFPNVTGKNLITANLLTETTLRPTVATKLIGTTRHMAETKKRITDVVTHTLPVADTPKNKFSVKFENDTTKNTFSVSQVKLENNRHTPNDLLNLTNKLIIIKGKVATTDEIRSLSLARIKYMMPFKATDNAGKGTFVEVYGEKAKNGGIMLILKNTDEQ